MHNITIVCADTSHSMYDALRTVEHCMSVFPCVEAMLFTNPANITSDNPRVKIKLVPSLNEKYSYDYFMLNVLHQYIKTDHFLIVQNDGYILNTKAWSDDFLKYDYIGAKWLYSPNHDWPPHVPVGPNNSVGNGGFCLRSKKLATVVSGILCQLDSIQYEHIYPEDCFIARDLRPLLETPLLGNLKFAPESIADRFSCENQIYNNQFGFHGKLTMKINNIPYIV